VLVSDGKASDQLFTQHVDPFNSRRSPLDPVMVDLSAWGRGVNLMFNTYASPPKVPGNMDNDLPLWGAPEIVIR
jgi:hypothetical protein